MVPRSCLNSHPRRVPRSKPQTPHRVSESSHGSRWVADTASLDRRHGHCCERILTHSPFGWPAWPIPVTCQAVVRANPHIVKPLCPHPLRPVSVRRWRSHSCGTGTPASRLSVVPRGPHLSYLCSHMPETASTTRGKSTTILPVSAGDEHR